MSKFYPLWNYIEEKDLDLYQISFEEIQNILGFRIDHSFLTYKKEAQNYGYEVTKISLKNKTVVIQKRK